jgi:hypothetical protein
MTEPPDHYRMTYIVMAAVAGSITSLAMLNWKDMSWTEILLTLFVGSSFAVFCVPWLAGDWLRIDITDLRAICGVTYFGATGANVFVPLLIRKVKSQIGDGA